jgi:antitoxin Phd
VGTDLKRIGEKACKEPRLVFTSLYHHITDIDNLRASYDKLLCNKASGVDGVTKAEYGKHLEENLRTLSCFFHLSSVRLYNSHEDGYLGGHMASNYSIAEARNRLPRLVHDVEKGATVTLTRRGKAVAVLISCAELQRIQGQGTSFSDAYEEMRKRFDLEKLAIDPVEVFERSSQPSGGREFSW